MRIYERMPVQERILRNVSMEPMSGCWLWTGYTDKGGYGRITIGKIGGKVKSGWVHRVAFEAFREPIPAGLEIDHLCRVRSCVNPNHMEAVTPRVNSLRGTSFVAVNAKKTHCPQGHEYRRTTTQRYCHICSRETARRYRERKRGLQWWDY